MKVLVIAAHMDDEVLGVGGTIAKHVAAGDRVTICIACQRAYDHQFTAKDVAREKASACRAAKILGCGEPVFLDLPDERLDERLLDVIVPLEACIKRVKPDVVYTHHRGDSNQDHRAVFQATVVACRAIAKPKVTRVLCYEVLSSTDQAPPCPEYAFQPNVYVHIEKFLARKVRAMEAYRRELRAFPHPRSSQGIRVLAQQRGMEVACRAAEAFILMRDEWA